MSRIGKNDAAGVIPAPAKGGSASGGKAGIHTPVPDKSIRGRHDSYRNHVGFSLVEVMIAVSILALGTVVIHQNFLKSASYFGRYRSDLEVSLWMSEKMWQAVEATLYSKEGPGMTGEGVVSLPRRDYGWSQTADSSNEKDLYRFLLDVQLDGDLNPSHLTKEIYAFKSEPSKA